MRYSGPLRSGRQIAAARGLARMTQAGLAEAGLWNVRTVRRWERAEGLPTSHTPHLSALIEIFAKAGVRFAADPLGVIQTAADQRA